MTFVFVFNCLFLSLFCESLFAAKMYYLPISFMACFYFSIYFTWQRSLTICLICATAQAELFHISALIPHLIIFSIAKTWKNQGDCSRAYVQWTAFSIAYLLAASSQVILTRNSIHLRAELLHFFLELICSLLILSIAFPFFITLMDFFANKFEIHTYTKTQREELLNARP